MQRKVPRAVDYDTDLMGRDMAALGWLRTDLARAARVSDMSVSRFFNGDARTERMAAKLAAALGKSVRRYIVRPAKTRAVV